MGATCHNARETINLSTQKFGEAIIILRKQFNKLTSLCNLNIQRFFVGLRYVVDLQQQTTNIRKLDDLR